MRSNSSAALQPEKIGNDTSVTATGPAPAWIALIGAEIIFPHGLLGFADVRRYRLQRFDPSEAKDSPFLILESADGQVSFPLIHPDSLGMDYHLPDVPDLRLGLQARSAADLAILLIVTVRDRVEDTTVNLQGPLVINTQSLLGMQVVVEEYPLRHPLLKPGKE